MLYRLTVDLFVPGSDVNLAKLQNLYDTINGRWADYINANGKERVKIVLHRCYHDEASPRPCETVTERAG